jgi:hypothetical protein
MSISMVKPSCPNPGGLAEVLTVPVVDPGMPEFGRW